MFWEGNSAIIDPLGVTRVSGGNGEEVLTVDIDPDLAAQWREEFPAQDDVVDYHVN